MKDGEQNCTNQSGNQDTLRETEKPDYSNKEHAQIKNNESSSKQVELSYIFERRNKIHKKNTRHTTEEAVTRDTKRQRRFHRY